MMSTNINNNAQRSLPIWQRITPRLIFNTVILAVVPIIIVAIATLFLIQQTIQQRVFSELDAISQLKSDEINHWISDSQSTLGLLLSLDRFTQNVITF